MVQNSSSWATVFSRLARLLPEPPMMMRAVSSSCPRARQLYAASRTDVFGQFALLELGGNIAVGLDDPERETAARAITVEAERQSGALGRAAIDLGEDSKRAVITAEQCRENRCMVESRVPHQRAVSEELDVAKGVEHVVSTERRHFTAIMYPNTATDMPINARTPKVSLNTKYPITAVVGGVR